MSLKRHDRGTVQTDGPGTGAHKCSASTIFASAVVDPCVDDGVDTWALDRRNAWPYRFIRCSQWRLISFSINASLLVKYS